MTPLSSMQVCENSPWAPPLDTLGPIGFLTFTVFFPIEVPSRDNLVNLVSTIDLS